MVSLIILLITALSISNNFYVTENIKQNIERNTNNQGWVDVVNFVISGRDRNVRSINHISLKKVIYLLNFWYRFILSFI